MSPLGAAPRGTVRAQVTQREQRLIAQHLLEVGHSPVRVHAVAGEAPAQVVVETAVTHGVERATRRRARPFVTPAHEKRLHVARTRKLGRARKSASLIRAVEEVVDECVDGGGPSVGGRRRTQVVDELDLSLDGPRKLVRLREHVGASVGPRLGHRDE